MSRLTDRHSRPHDPMDIQQDNVLTYREIILAVRGRLRFPEHPREQQVQEAVRYGTADSADEIRGTDDHD